MKSSKYSLGGYAIAVLQRGSKTLVVEGVSDKAVLSRMILEKRSDKLPIIDQIDIVEDDALTGMGAKQRVQYLRDFYGDNPRISAKLATLVDREWDGVVDDQGAILDVWQPPEQKTQHFITQGHSVENYHFHLECILGFVKFAHAEFFSRTFEDTVKDRFPAVLAFCGAYSMEIASRSIIGRCNDLVKIEHLSFDGARYRVHDSILEELETRQVPDPTTFATALNNRIETHWTQIGQGDQARWLVHGHLGENALWKLISSIAEELGATPAVVAGIGRSKCNERNNYWREWLSSTSTIERNPLDAIVDWLAGGPPTHSQLPS